MTAGTQVRFVSLADAVATVREAEQAGVQMTRSRCIRPPGFASGCGARHS